MRTTLQIDDDVLKTAKAMASARGVSLGQIVSELVREALKPRADYRTRRNFPVFQVREDAPVFGPQDVQDALDE